MIYAMENDLDIVKYDKLLDDSGLPENTPKDLVIELLKQMEDSGMNRNDVSDVEKILLDSALWNWVQGEDITLNEKLPFEQLAQRIATLFGV